MTPVCEGLARVRQHFVGENEELIKIIANSVSSAEANLALSVLSDRVPEKALVALANLREVIAALPSCPFPMGIDIDSLARVGGFTKVKGAWRKALSDPGGDYALMLLAEGNLCFDMVISTARENVFWTPCPVQQDRVRPEAIDMLFRHDTLLPELVELVQTMAVTYYPKFYLSMEDWALEYAGASLEELQGLF